MDKSNFKKQLRTIIILLIICVPLSFFTNLQSVSLVYSVFSALLEVCLWIFGIRLFINIINKKKKETIQSEKDVFEQNINNEIFKTSDNIKEATHKAEHIINNEKCEVIIEKPTKECSFCGAKNPTSAKHCDCCGKKL